MPAINSNATNASFIANASDSCVLYDLCPKPPITSVSFLVMIVFVVNEDKSSSIVQSIVLVQLLNHILLYMHINGINHRFPLLRLQKILMLFILLQQAGNYTLSFFLVMPMKLVTHQEAAIHYSS